MAQLSYRVIEPFSHFIFFMLLAFILFPSLLRRALQQLNTAELQAGNAKGWGKVKASGFQNDAVAASF
jgi:hypothetical protein